MNDEFLYALRRQPPTEFALELKAKLDREQGDKHQRRRSMGWFFAGAALVAGGAFAFVSPVLRDASHAFITYVKGDRDAQALEPSEATSPKQLPRERTNSQARWEVVTLPENGASKEQTQGPLAPPIEALDQAASQASSISSSSRSETPSTSVLLAPNGLPRATLQIAYVGQLGDLVGKLATDVEKRSTSVAVGLTDWAGADDICERDLRSISAQVVISDAKLMQSGRDSCNGFHEIPFAYRAIAVVANAESTWLQRMSVAELKLLAAENVSPLLTWNQVRADWPTVTLMLFGESLDRSDSGRRLTEVLEVKSATSMFRTTESGAETLRQVEQTFGSMGFIDYASLRTRHTSARIVQLSRDNSEPVQPNVDSIQTGRYPLRTTVRMYVRLDRRHRADVWQSIQHLPASAAISEAGLIPLGAEDRQQVTDFVRKVKLSLMY